MNGFAENIRTRGSKHTGQIWNYERQPILSSSASYQADRLVQERHNSITNALELHLSCNNPSRSLWGMWCVYWEYSGEDWLYHIRTAMYSEKFGRKQTMFWQANNIFCRERQECLLIILEKTDYVTTGLHYIFKKKLCAKYEEFCVSHLCQPVQCQGNRPALGWWCAYSGGLCHPTHQATAPGSNGGDIICRGLINSLAPGRPRCYFKTAIWNLVLLISIFTSFKDNALRWMPRDLTDDKSTLIQVMAWCRQATSHYLNHCWPRSLPPNGVTRPQWVKMANIFVTDTLKFIFENENFQISNKI